MRDPDDRHTPLDALRASLAAVVEEMAGGAGAGVTSGRRSLVLERPPKPELGDYASNVALAVAKAAGMPPRELAARLGEGMSGRLGEELVRFEVAGPGFLNLFLADAWHRRALAEVLDAGEGFGGGGVGDRGERVLVEFVSANPTGPLHVGHARNAAYGDSLARLLAFHGHDVEREFYVNDAGSQVRKLGESIGALARGEQVPADGYQGDYVQNLLASLTNAASMDAAELGGAAVNVMMGQIMRSLQRFGVAFDHVVYETTLHQPREDLKGAGGGPLSAVEHALELLAQRGHTYESEGALWLRSTEMGDDKDRVLVRSTGEHTYFASDIAYHQAKRERGFERQIDVWGADHHGYMKRMRAAYVALGGQADELEMVIMQLVHLLRGGQRAQMSKRSGEFVTVDDLVEEIGVDAARWFLLSRSHETTIDLDLDLAVRQSSENPVFYVQYAHARIVSMLEKAGAGRVEAALAEIDGDGPDLHPAERDVVKALVALPEEVGEAAQRRAPHRIAAYALDLAQRFTAFYRDCRVVGAEDRQAESLRIALCVASRNALARSLWMLGVGAPEQM